MLTIAVVDDTAKWITLAENHIKHIDGCTVLVKAYNGIEFIDWCYHNRELPDMAVVDVEMPKMDGVQLTDFLTEQFPSIKVIAASSHSNKEVVEDMIGCGAYAFVSKLYNVKNLPAAVAAVSKGHVYIDPILLLENINRDQLMAVRKKQKHLYNNVAFTSKQKALIALYTTSASQKEIAGTLSVSEKTLESQVKTVSQKLKVGNRQDLTLNTIRKGFIRVARIFKEV